MFAKVHFEQRTISRNGSRPIGNTRYIKSQNQISAHVDTYNATSLIITINNNDFLKTTQGISVDADVGGYHVEDIEHLLEEEED